MESMTQTVEREERVTAAIQALKAEEKARPVPLPLKWSKASGPTRRWKERVCIYGVDVWRNGPCSHVYVEFARMTMVATPAKGDTLDHAAVIAAADVRAERRFLVDFPRKGDASEAV